MTKASKRVACAAGLLLMTWSGKLTDTTEGYNVKMVIDASTNPDGLAQVRILLSSGRQPPLGVKLGISLVEAEYGHAVFEATPDGTSYNPMGSVHGGYISAILDSACGIAAHTGLKPGFGYTTLELKVSFLRALNDTSGKIRAVGRLISMGGRAAFSEATLFNESGQICATATSTLLVFELRPAKVAVATL